MMGLHKPCAVFWDIQHVECCIQHAIPTEQSVTSIVNLIRTTIIKPHNLSETSFFWVGDSRKLSSYVWHSLTALDVDIVHAYNGIKISANIKISLMDLMRKFVRFAGQDCTIILLSGNATYCDTLSDLKRLHNVSIHLVRLADSCSSKLDQIADYTFMLNNGVLKPVKSTGSPKYFISIENYPYSSNILIMNELNGQAIGSIENSAILYDCFICIGFPTLWNAERAIEQLNGSQIAYETFAKVELLVDSPLTEILKCLNHNVTKETKTYNEVKQLTFIKMNNSNKTDIRFIIKFISACTAQSSSQCILSRKLFLWIVFALKSDAQKFLPKLQEMYPDAVISESPSDLALAFHENPYTVESCKLKVTDETTLDFEADNEPEMAMQVNAQYQSCSIKPAVDIHLSAESKASKESEETSQEPQNIVNRDVPCDNELNMFFRCHYYTVSHELDCQPSKWSLLYNLFEKLYDLGAKKVIFDGKVYCAHFDSASAYQEAFERIRSCYLEHLEFVNVSEVSMVSIVNNAIQTFRNFRNISAIPWCLNEKLCLYCLRVKIKSNHHADFIEMSKNILRNQECIFIKSLPGEIWIGFPDEIICENSKKRKDAVIACCTHKNDVSMAKPSNELLESINFHDLVGDAYDLAFLSRLLEDVDLIDEPDIIERIGLQRMEEKECNEGAYHIEVQGYFINLSFVFLHNLLSVSQSVKIFVNFSKVIPLAATASYRRVRLSYYSFYEAEFARHCINKLKTVEVPYFEEFHGVPSVVENNLCSDISEYYIINDKRKVLEKIIQNKILVDKLDSNSSTVQSTSDIDVKDRDVAQKLKFLFVVTANSEFKLTSRIISIIKMHLVEMDFPVCIEFEDKIWVAVDDLEKGNKVKARIEKIKFKLLHENDEDDFDVGVVAKLVSNFPPKVFKMLANKLVNSTKTHTHMHTNWYLDNDAVPLGHFNYNYRKAVGISASQYFKT